MLPVDLSKQSAANRQLGRVRYLRLSGSSILDRQTDVYAVILFVFEMCTVSRLVSLGNSFSRAEKQ